MNNIFTKQELEILQEIIQKEITAMPIEIHHSTRGEFKDFLKEKQAILEKLLEKINSAL
ncbi:MAG: hypothetical protein GXY14_15700 [Spirochaetes bacterium]|nr:hypothetical protein [Spirochaetota bacterium]